MGTYANHINKQLLSFSFSAQLPNLVEFSIESAAHITVNIINKIVESHKQLTKIELSIKDFKEFHVKQQFGNLWHIETVSDRDRWIWPALSLEKKNWIHSIDWTPFKYGKYWSNKKKKK